jgi:hypothetical protein
VTTSSARLIDRCNYIPVHGELVYLDHEILLLSAHSRNGQVREVRDLVSARISTVKISSESLEPGHLTRSGFEYNIPAIEERSLFNALLYSCNTFNDITSCRGLVGPTFATSWGRRGWKLGPCLSVPKTRPCQCTVRMMPKMEARRRLLQIPVVP